MNDFVEVVISFILGIFLISIIVFVFTYPIVGENNAEFFCESRDLVVKDFGQDRGSLVFVECEENPVNITDRFYWESVSDET